MTGPEEAITVPDLYFGLVSRWAETADGERTHYHDQGQGTPVTLLHGSGAGVSAAANWWLTIPDLSKHYRTIAPDLVGFGYTEPGPDAEFGIAAWVSHTARLLDHLEIDKTWLIGNSLGGWIALEFGLRFPDRLLGIVSMGTGGAARSETLARHSAPDISANGVRRVLKAFVVDESLITDELVEARLNVAGAANAAERYATVIAARERDRANNGLDFEALHDLDLPILLMHGLQDRVIPWSWSWDLCHALPHADLQLYADCGHWIQIERRLGFNLSVQGFITQHSQ